MKRRPKLSLAPANGTAKRQAPGFESTSATPPEGTPRTRRTRYKAASRHNVGPASEEAINEPRLWPGAAQVAKALLIVAAAALSLYLLKRRLF